MNKKAINKSNQQNNQAFSKSKVRKLSEDTRGLSTVEYLILLVVIAIAGISLWKKIGENIKIHAQTSANSLGDLNKPSK